jgi:hypothetical protein
MALDIRFFGQTGPHQVIIDDHGTATSLVIRRDLWFDRDVDGRWLIWAKREAQAALNGEGDRPEAVGAIVVRDATAIALIDELAQLLVDPGQFRDEPVFRPPGDRAAEATNG